jgi:hypothetical protein
VVVGVVVTGGGMSVLVPVVGKVVTLVRELSVDVVGAAVATGALVVAADDVAGGEVVGLTAPDPVVVGVAVVNKLRSCVLLEIGSD